MNFWGPVLIKQPLQAQFTERNRSQVETDIATGAPNIGNNVSYPVKPSPAIRAAPMTPGFTKPEFDGQ